MVTSPSVPEYFTAPAIRDDWKSKIAEWGGGVSALVAYRTVLRDPNVLYAHFSSDNVESWPDLDKNGWVEPPDSPYSLFRGTEVTVASISSENISALESLLTLLNDREIDTAVVWMPATDDWISRFVGGAATIGGFRDEIETLAQGLGDGW